MTRWELVGRIAVLLLASVLALSLSSIVELYWPGVYEAIVEGAMVYALIWAILMRRMES